MSKIHLDRLQKKYPVLKKASEAGMIKGEVYSDLINMIIEENSTKIQNRIVRQSKNNWDKALKKISTKEKRFIIPDLSDIFPKRSVGIKKAAEKGQLLRDNLRDQLTSQLRTAMNEFGEVGYITRRGRTAGRINPKLINVFENKIKNTFSTYNKKDPKYGVPVNIHGIAVTEVRGAVNEIKYKYNQTLLERNPDLEMRKTWIQNKSMSEVPRRGHSAVDGKTISYDEHFKVPKYKKIKGRHIKIGIDYMLYPHDPDAPVEQIVNCSCDYDVLILKKHIQKGLVSREILYVLHKGKFYSYGTNL